MRWKPTPDAGLSDEEAEQRRQRFGANQLTPHSQRPALMRLASQFNNLFIYLLLSEAPERVFEMCSSEWRNGETAELNAETWRRRIDEIAGPRAALLAVARKDLGNGMESLDEEQVERELTVLGLFGLIDPPREEAIEALGVHPACMGATYQALVFGFLGVRFMEMGPVADADAATRLPEKWRSVAVTVIWRGRRYPIEVLKKGIEP